ncbi:hypothetical protein Dred_0813 [Desulforamulus reducens MI-1]|uniref:Uncharacterized protein n=1 Tax=Desulforamulus reducens (strain ATCC BAA-1160 / DSM 100696 / MI-1) TaxID=349161 RepID=A4J2P8_DESRM|nr:hypothetical protein [Desulforamulus reducens]ABO49351.1 hypothetical protein Dred_0813 [Desulforamulus reducens MI-1]
MNNFKISKTIKIFLAGYLVGIFLTTAHFNYKINERDFLFSQLLKYHDAFIVSVSNTIKEMEREYGHKVAVSYSNKLKENFQNEHKKSINEYDAKKADEIFENNKRINSVYTHTYLSKNQSVYKDIVN